MLRKLLVLLAMLVAVLALSVSPAFADDDDDDDDGGGGSPTLIDFTFGSGTADFDGALGPLPPAIFDFDVESGPTGVAGSGDFTSVFEVSFSGPATCLEVQGNLAVFEIDNQNPANASDDLVVFVGDFGLAGQGDQINFHVISGADATCPTPASTDQPTIVGDIVVGDDQVRPRGGDGDDGDDDDDGGGDDDDGGDGDDDGGDGDDD